MLARILVSLLGCVAALASVPAAAVAADYAPSAFAIQHLVTGLSSDRVLVYPVGSVENPESCSVADAYQSDANTAGHDKRTLLLVSAHMSERIVTIHIDGCTANGRPKITSVGLTAGQ